MKAVENVTLELFCRLNQGLRKNLVLPTNIFCKHNATPVRKYSSLWKHFCSAKSNFLCEMIFFSIKYCKKKLTRHLDDSKHKINIGKLAVSSRILLLERHRRDVIEK